MSFFARLFNRPPSAKRSPREFLAERTAETPVLDVRTAGEYVTGHLVGAVNVDVMSPQFAEQVQRLAKQQQFKPDMPIYLYCRSGSRSAKATAVLRKMGFEAAYNVGGYAALRAAGAKTTA